MKKKIKIKSIAVIVVVLLVLIVSTIKIIDTINYHKTYEYKLLQIGYSKEEVKNIEKLSNEKKDYILTIQYNKNINNLIKEKYFLEKNLEKYLEYIEQNDKSLNDVVAIINVGSNKDWYTDTKESDISKEMLVLTNKFYSLSSDYIPEDLVNISNRYSYGTNQKIRQEAFDAFLNMFNDAKKEDLTLIINSSFRSYDDQEKTYNYYKDLKGSNYADTIAAKAGFSEHQTGLAIDIQTYGSSASTFEEFEEFKWLQENAYKYGFILRYPKDKEYLTGYEYESWHYRYVGIEVATYIHENNITFDEYYAYFLE